MEKSRAQRWRRKLEACEDTFPCSVGSARIFVHVCLFALKSFLKMLWSLSLSGSLCNILQKNPIFFHWASSLTIFHFCIWNFQFMYSWTFLHRKTKDVMLYVRCYVLFPTCNWMSDLNRICQRAETEIGQHTHNFVFLLCVSGSVIETMRFPLVWREEYIVF